MARVAGLLFVAVLLVFVAGSPRGGDRVGVGTSQIADLLGSSAQAQETRKRRSLFSILFGRKKARKAVVKRRKKRVRRVRRPKRNVGRKTRRAKARRPAARKRANVRRKAAPSSTRRTSAARTAKRQGGGRRNALKKRVAPVPAVTKSENAGKVLVIGDFFAGNLAGGLSELFADAESIVVVDGSNVRSGLVRDDVVNWPAKLESLIAEDKPNYILAMVGANDRQLLKSDGRNLKKRTPEWDEAYRKRVVALGDVLKKSGIGYTWVGLPPVRSGNMNKDYLFFNELYRKAAESKSGQFVDVWDGFSDADGNYSRSGPDVKGQIALLRFRDGINMTRAGRQRLAFYVESTVRRALQGNEQFNAAAGLDLESTDQPAAAYDPAQTGRTVVVRLDDPSADGALALAGDRTEQRKSAPRSFASSPVPLPRVSDKAPVSGVRHGRVDDYRWPPAGPASTQTPTDVVTAN